MNEIEKNTPTDADVNADASANADGLASAVADAGSNAEAAASVVADAGANAEAAADVKASVNDAQEQQGASKRGFAITLVALIVVLAVGFVAYNMLANGQTSGNAGQAASTSASQAAQSDATAASGASSGSSSESSSQGANDVEGPALADYDATVYTEYGDARTLTQLADGKPFVMNFWATWCTYCVAEMDDYQQIFDEYDGRVSFAFIDLADGTRETVESASTWLFENEYTLPAYYDTKREAMYAFGATSLPTTVVVSASGEILTIDVGRIDPDRMREVLDKLLEA